MSLFGGLPPPFSIALFFVVGLALGSFGNVLIVRLPAGESIGGRSRCPHCKHALRWRDLIPVVSYAWLRGRCRTCRAGIAWRYPAVELASAMLFTAGMVHESGIVAGVALGTALWVLLLIAVVDARTQRIPDALNAALAAAAVVYAGQTGAFDILAPAAALGFFGGQWVVSRGRWVGSGDVLLAAAIGILLGSFGSVVVAVFAAYGIGAIVVLMLLLAGKVQRRGHVAFGPFLALGALFAVFFGEEVLSCVLSGLERCPSIVAI